MEGWLHEVLNQTQDGNNYFIFIIDLQLCSCMSVLLSTLSHHHLPLYVIFSLLDLCFSVFLSFAFCFVFFLFRVFCIFISFCVPGC